MRAIKIEEVDNETEITVETGRWIFKKQTVFRSAGVLVGKFSKWIKMPNKEIVEDIMSFQLDSWKETGI